MNLKSLLSGLLAAAFTAIPTLASGIASPVIHAVVIGAGAIVGVFVHGQATSLQLWKGNPFGTITVTSLITAVLGFIAAHLDPSQLTALGTAVLGILGGVVGTLTHHAVTFPGASE